MNGKAAAQARATAPKYSVAADFGANTKIRRDRQPNRLCLVCGNAFIATRATARFCSSRCRKWNHRRDHRAVRQPELKSTNSLLRRWLLARNYAGAISRADPSVVGLVVPRKFAVDEWNLFRREDLSDRDFVAALKELGIVDYGVDLRPPSVPKRRDVFSRYHARKNGTLSQQKNGAKPPIPKPQKPPKIQTRLWHEGAPA